MQLNQLQQGAFGQQLQGAGLEQQARQDASTRMFQEWLQRQNLPPILQQMMGIIGGLPTPDTVVSTGQA
jgi:hypothetical protein